jgi:hypothetical protein
MRREFATLQIMKNKKYTMKEALLQKQVLNVLTLGPIT